MKQLPPLKIGDFVSRVPIIQGGMGVGISLSGLASAVANAGGIGVISAAMPGMAEPDILTNCHQANIRALKNEIHRARQLTDGIIGVNIMVALTNFGDMVKTAISERVDIIFCGAGLPLNLPEFKPQATPTKLVPIVSSGRAAKLICQKWISRYAYTPDAFVVEGPKAGGHLGFKTAQIDDPDFSLEKLVTEVIAALKPFKTPDNSTIPVIAAGGIYTGEDIYNFLELGANGIQMGTRFVATHECDADDAFKQSYIDAREEDVVIIKSPVGLPGRAIRNTFIDEVQKKGTRRPFKCPYHCLKSCKGLESRYCIAVALSNACKGKFKYGFAFAGENAYRIDNIVSVEELMNSLQAEYSQACDFKKLAN
jgi:nitronate monooxygenase